MELRMISSAIDNGSHFNMRARDLTFQWKNSWDTENEPCKDIGSGWNFAAATARYNGFETPVLNFTGIIDTSVSSTSSYDGGSLYITVERLGSMTRLGSAYLLYPAINNFIGSPFSDLLLGSIPCAINSCNLSVNTNYVNGSEYIINYNMQVTLVRDF